MHSRGEMFTYGYLHLKRKRLHCDLKREKSIDCEQSCNWILSIPGPMMDATLSSFTVQRQGNFRSYQKTVDEEAEIHIAQP